MGGPRSGAPPGRFITLEGIEGSGKTTQAALLADALRQAGLAVTATREPGGTPLAERIRSLVLDGDGGPGPEAELFLYLAARADHVVRRLRPDLARGHWVVCDRYADATVAYQGYGRGLDLRRVRSLVRWAGTLVPDLTVLVDVPVETGLERAGRRGGENRLDREGEAFHQRVRAGYLTLAEAEPERIAVIDGARPVAQVLADVLDAVSGRLGVAFSPSRRHAGGRP